MMLVAADFIFSVFSLYSLYRVYMTLPFNVVEFRGSMIHFLWTLYYDFFIMIIIWLGSSIHTEVFCILYTFQNQYHKIITSILGIVHRNFDSQNNK